MQPGTLPISNSLAGQCHHSIPQRSAVVNKVKTYYTDQLEEYAEVLWRELQLSCPVDLLAVCEHLGIALDKSPMGSDLSGICLHDGPKPMILVNSLEILGRQRFTVAHEIAEHLLIEMLGQPLDPGRSRVDRDQRCDRFAAALLMPHWFMRKWWEELASNPTGRVAVLADRFEVTMSAVRNRARYLQLETRR